VRDFSKSGWTGVLVAARYGFADVVRELITKYGCDRNAVVGVSWSCQQLEYVLVIHNSMTYTSICCRVA